MGIDPSGPDELTKCRWCGTLHGPMCPYVKALEFDAEGLVTRVEFLAPIDYPRWATEAKEPEPDYRKIGGD